MRDKPEMVDVRIVSVLTEAHLPIELPVGVVLRVRRYYKKLLIVVPNYLVYVYCYPAKNPRKWKYYVIRVAVYGQHYWEDFVRYSVQIQERYVLL